MQITAAFVEKADGAVTRRNIKLKAVELEDPREDEDLIKVTSCGVCGTDQEIIHGLELVPASGVLGHEGAGIVGAIDDSDDHKMIKPIVRMRWTHEGEAPCHRTPRKRPEAPSSSHPPPAPVIGIRLLDPSPPGRDRFVIQARTGSSSAWLRLIASRIDRSTRPAWWYETLLCSLFQARASLARKAGTRSTAVQASSGAMGVPLLRRKGRPNMSRASCVGSMPAWR